MMNNLGLLYLEMMRNVWPWHGNEESEIIAGEIVIRTADIRINRETKDLELRVSGEIQLKSGEREQEEYCIHFPMWNYSPGLKEKGISKETYDEVMTEERNMLFAKYVRMWIILSQGATEQITERAYSNQRKIAGIKYHNVLQDLIEYQTNVYIKLKTREAEKKREPRIHEEDAERRDIVVSRGYGEA